MSKYKYKVGDTVIVKEEEYLRLNKLEKRGNLFVFKVKRRDVVGSENTYWNSNDEGWYEHSIAGVYSETIEELNKTSLQRRYE